MLRCPVFTKRCAKPRKPKSSNTKITVAVRSCRISKLPQFPRGERGRCHAHITEARASTKVALHRAFIEAVAVHGIADIVHRQLGVYVLISTSVTYLSSYLHTAATALWNFKHAGQATYGQNGPRLEAARYCELPHS